MTIAPANSRLPLSPQTGAAIKWASAASAKSEVLRHHAAEAEGDWIWHQPGVFIARLSRANPAPPALRNGPMTET